MLEKRLSTGVTSAAQHGPTRLTLPARRASGPSSVPPAAPGPAGGRLRGRAALRSERRGEPREEGGESAESGGDGCRVGAARRGEERGAAPRGVGGRQGFPRPEPGGGAANSGSGGERAPAEGPGSCSGGREGAAAGH